MKSWRARIQDLFRSPYLVPMVALAIFYSLVNLGFNTYGQFGTYLLVNVAGTDVSTASTLALVAIPVGFVGALWFMRVVDKPHRFAYFRVGAAMTVVAMLVPAIFGFTVITYVVSIGLMSVGAAFAGESIMKVWTQEQFPTLLRTTAQGAVIAIARFVAAAGAAVAPAVVALGVSYLFVALAILSAVGLGAAWVVFRTRDQVTASARRPRRTNPGLRSPRSEPSTSVGRCAAARAVIQGRHRLMGVAFPPSAGEGDRGTGGISTDFSQGSRVNRPGVSGDSEPWEGWSHVRKNVEEVSG